MMHVAPYFLFKGEAEKIAFMKQYSFATIVTVKNNVPVATALPFFVDDTREKLILSSHFAATNPQAIDLEEGNCLVIFSEPHAYISPTFYDKYESVPTWDYIAVHAYGKARIVSDEDIQEGMLQQMISFYEPGYAVQWNSLPEKFKVVMKRGIVAFEIEITELQGKKKLSQNKTEVERQRIVDHLMQSSDSVERDIASFIQGTIKDSDSDGGRI